MKTRDELAEAVHAVLVSGDRRLTGEVFTVICTNPAKSAAIEACEFSTADWTEEDAIQQFATDHNLDLSDVAIED